MNKQFFRLPKNRSVRFRDYSLHTKLLIFFLAVALILLGILIFIDNRGGAGNCSPRYL